MTILPHCPLAFLFNIAQSDRWSEEARRGFKEARLTRPRRGAGRLLGPGVRQRAQVINQIADGEQVLRTGL
jgi:hypothetical protein